MFKEFLVFPTEVRTIDKKCVWYLKIRNFKALNPSNTMCMCYCVCIPLFLNTKVFVCICVCVVCVRVCIHKNEVKLCKLWIKFFFSSWTIIQHWICRAKRTSVIVFAGFFFFIIWLHLLLFLWIKKDVHLFSFFFTWNGCDMTWRRQTDCWEKIKQKLTKNLLF